MLVYKNDRYASYAELPKNSNTSDTISWKCAQKNKQQKLRITYKNTKVVSIHYDYSNAFLHST